MKYCLEVAEVLDSPRYICCEKCSEPAWLFASEVTARSAPFGRPFQWGGISVWVLPPAKTCIPWRKAGIWLHLLYPHFFNGHHTLQRGAGCESALSSGKFTSFMSLISIFYLCLSLGVRGFFLELQRCPFLRHRKTLTQDLLLFLMYFKGWLSFNSVKIQLCLARLC